MVAIAIAILDGINYIATDLPAAKRQSRPWPLLDGIPVRSDGRTDHEPAARLPSTTVALWNFAAQTIGGASRALQVARQTALPTSHVALSSVNSTSCPVIALRTA